MRLPSALDVWVVDDEPAMLSVVERALAAAEFNVRTFSTARQVKADLRASTPGVVVADLFLGDEDGLELISHIQANVWPAPAVLISGRLDPQLTVRSVRSGCISVLEKPFGLPVLCREVETAHRLAKERVEFLQRRAEAAKALNDLSPGHRAVLDLLIECRPHKQIARELGIALRTVEKRKKDAFERLGIDTYTELIRLLILAHAEPDWSALSQPLGRPRRSCPIRCWASALTTASPCPSWSTSSALEPAPLDIERYLRQQGRKHADRACVLQGEIRQASGGVRR